MSKAVLISIRPKWCQLIASGEKILEVRKTRPKLERPFKCYIYCTAGTGKNTFNVPIHYETILKDYIETGSMRSLNCHIGNGKVIGEFICDTFVIDKTFGHDPFFNGAACMSEAESAAYSCSSPIYGWHIFDLAIYDKPKELSEFFGLRHTKFGLEPVSLKRPPQSWCYVEEMEE